jgi:hypothetical protein
MRRVIGPLLVFALAACSPEIVSTAGSGNPTAAGSPGASAGAAGSGSPALPASAAPSLAPSASPSAAPSIGTLSIFPPGSAIQVTVSELNLREAPSTTAKRVAILKKGQILIVSPYDGVWFGAGPRKKDGYTWYPVIKLQVEGPDGGLPPLPTRPVLLGTEVVVGWLATHDGTKPYVKQLAPRCPTSVDLPNVQAMLSAERLACFAGPIVLEGTYGCPSCGAELTGDFKPIWLNYPQALEFLSVDVHDQVGPIILRFPPDGPANPDGGAIIRVTVHVDDPAAVGCSIKISGEPAVPPSTALLYCREQLVVDSYEVIGTDPDFDS